MGLFDSLFGGTETNTRLSPQECFAGILLGASACDGYIADDEVQGLLAALFRMKLFERVNEKQFGQIINKLHKFQKKSGVDALIDGCVQNLPKELTKAAFANACDIVLADGIVDPDEKEFIDKLQKKLELPDNLAKTIAQVMVLKNKG